MSQFSPETIIGNRYKILSPLSGDQSIDRYRAFDQQNDVEVEIITPTARNILKPDQRSHFLDIHRANQSEKEGYLRCLDTFLEGSTVAAIYPSVRTIFPQTISLSIDQTENFIRFVAPLLEDIKENLYYSNLVVTEQGEF